MKIAVLGCGWLGFPLARRLVQEGYQVKGSVTKEAKISKLAAAGIEPFQIDLSVFDCSKVDSFLRDIEVLIIMVPPKHQSADFDLITSIQLLLDRAVKHKVPRVLYTSSISVYEDTAAIPICSEQDVWKRPTERATKLLQAEEMIMRGETFQACVLRLGGLLGMDRHPIKYLAGKQNVPNPAAPVNLVHQKDCIGVIVELLKRDWFDGILNVVHPAHPNKREYYTAAAKARNLVEPQFCGLPSRGKIVSGEKLQRELNYSFVMEI